MFTTIKENQKIIEKIQQKMLDDLAIPKDIFQNQKPSYVDFNTEFRHRVYGLWLYARQHFSI